MDIRYPIHIFALLSLSQASSAQKKPAMDQKKPQCTFRDVRSAQKTSFGIYEGRSCDNS